MITLHAINALRDNYIWCIEDTNSHQCLIVDPGEHEPVIVALNEKQLTPLAILITHHHWDHTDGIPGLVDYYKLPVYGPNNPAISSLTHPLTAGDTINFSPMSLTFSVMEIPGHTLDHIAYVGQDMLFCGDTLFSAGCGRLFEGTPDQMHQSLNSIAKLPDHTLVYCAHEYTLNNLRFTQQLDPHNPELAPRIAACQQERAQNRPTLPVSLGLEKALNPFLRCNSPAITQAAEDYSGQTLSTPLDVFATIREMKNRF